MDNMRYILRLYTVRRVLGAEGSVTQLHPVHSRIYCGMSKRIMH